MFFDGLENYRKYRDDHVLSPGTFGALYVTDPRLLKRFAVDRLHMIKISFVRATPQGGVIERDMHSGQQYVRLLDLELSRP